mgnify:CR=1 FL=1
MLFFKDNHIFLTYASKWLQNEFILPMIVLVNQLIKAYAWFLTLKLTYPESVFVYIIFLSCMTSSYRIP